MKNALIVVDVQRDFCEGGALAINDTLSLISPLEDFIDALRKRNILIVFTQDWHPSNHKSFVKNGGIWPVHCVQNSDGAELMPPLTAQQSDLIIHKGIDSETDGYSAFESVELTDKLHTLGVQSIAICGIATEYCVRATALDALKKQFKVTILSDLIRPVDPQATSTVLKEIAQKGGLSCQSHLFSTI